MPQVIKFPHRLAPRSVQVASAPAPDRRAATKAGHSSNVRPLNPDIAERYFAGEVRSVPVMRPIDIARRAMGEPLDPYLIIRPTEEPKLSEGWFLVLGAVCAGLWVAAFYIAGMLSA